MNITGMSRTTLIDSAPEVVRVSKYSGKKLNCLTFDCESTIAIKSLPCTSYTAHMRWKMVLTGTSKKLSVQHPWPTATVFWCLLDWPALRAFASLKCRTNYLFLCRFCCVPAKWRDILILCGLWCFEERNSSHLLPDRTSNLDCPNETFHSLLFDELV